MPPDLVVIVILRHQAVPAYAIGLALGIGAVGGLALARRWSSSCTGSRRVSSGLAGCGLLLQYLPAQTAMLTLAVAMAAVTAYGLSPPRTPPRPLARD